MNKDCYVALFRGINVGGHKKVPMARVREVFASLGFEDVQTLLNSGNVVFAAPNTDADSLAVCISQAMDVAFGFSIPTLIRSKADIAHIVKQDPFASVDILPTTRCYVTFVSAAPASSIQIPWISQTGDFQILSADEAHVYSILELSKSMGTVDAMKILEKNLGTHSTTTRNWKTVKKVWQLMVDG